MSDDYIKREDAVKAFAESNVFPQTSTTPTSYYAVADAILRKVPAADAVERSCWIPVTEQLPEDDDKRFLVCAKRFDGEPYMHICYHAKNLHEFDEYDFPTENRPGWYFYDREYGWIEKEDVTHWMPLPEPPKEVDT